METSLTPKSLVTEARKRMKNLQDQVEMTTMDFRPTRIEASFLMTTQLAVTQDCTAPPERVIFSLLRTLGSLHLRP